MNGLTTHAITVQRQYANTIREVIWACAILLSVCNKKFTYWKVFERKFNHVIFMLPVHLHINFKIAFSTPSMVAARHTPAVHAYMSQKLVPGSGVFRGRAMAPFGQKTIFFTIGKFWKNWFGPPLCKQ